MNKRITRDLPEGKFDKFAPAFYSTNKIYGIITDIDKLHEVCYIRALNDPQEVIQVGINSINIEDDYGSDEIYEKLKNYKDNGEDKNYKNNEEKAQEN